jgi:RimJ/RimL family protein N-acetyltransferase
MNYYKCLKNQNFSIEKYKIVPIRFNDRFEIMKWRNEQIYHLRQEKPLTIDDQNFYFNEVIAKLFDQDRPSQILFSFLENDICIGYGGLVHINWTSLNAEISFIMNTNLEEKYFKKYWHKFLCMLEKVSFGELHLHKIYTYAYGIRPKLFQLLEDNGYEKEATLREHIYSNGVLQNIVVHSKFNK